MQVRWAKLRGTPGSPQDKLTEAEREVRDSSILVVAWGAESSYWLATHDSGEPNCREPEARNTSA
jgi:hypothetical protein